ncbi:hypothetical protein HK099_005183 [Clydaea vesicula]|uniref:C2H2-type domain-containing protein n=1 Tax=Clydaea vesicula TaxID=447962 RepID=A0AAD5U2S0_9FUNG|nr:hypothetical protein HK099_005183 [Clydaea vesicula]
MDKKLCKCLWKNCNFAFSEEKETFEHVFTTHSVKGRQDCLWISNHFKGPCNERFKHKGQFKDHLVTHFSLDFRPLACPFCCKRLRSRQELGKHKKTHTTNSQPLQKNSETTNTFNNQINSTQFQAPIISIKSLITNNYNYSSIVSIPCIKSEPNINLTSFLYTAKNRISPLTMTHTSISALELSCNDQPVVDYSHVKGKERLSDRNNCQIVKIIPCVEEKKYKNQNFEDLELLCNTAIATHYKVPNNLSLTHEIGFNICMVLGLSEMFNKDYGIIIPEDFKNMIIAIFKREGSHGRVPPNYLRLLDTLWRRTPYALPFKQQMEEKYHVQDQIKRSKKIFNVMFKNFTAVLRKVLKLELDNLNDQGET